MKNRIPGKPGRYSAVVPSEDVTKLQSGEPFSITLTRNDNPVEEGTPYSKETVLPDTVAEELCPDNSNPTPADAFASLANVKRDVGDKENVFGFMPNHYEEDSYVNKQGALHSQGNCDVFLISPSSSPEIVGRAVTIRTYMYGDMAIDFPLLHENVNNSAADIKRDPKSGIFEHTFYFPDDVDLEKGDDNGIWISFCENPYFTEPVAFEPNGTVWQEIKNLKNSGGGGTGGGSVDNAVLYAHINDKSNPHRVTAKQIGAATQESLDALSDAMFGGTFVEMAELEPEVLRILEEHDINGGGGAVIDDEDISTDKTWSSDKIASTFAEHATLGDLEQCLYDAKEYTDEAVGNIESALDELHTYAQGLINGGGA